MSAAEHIDTGLELDVEGGRESGRMRRIDPDVSGPVEVQRESHPDLRAGDIVADRYVIDAVIGSGGHGAIHRARHVDLDMPVAVKVLHMGAPERPHAELVQRFQREAMIAARIRHRNVLSVQDTGRLADGTPFIVMELIDGDDLEKRIARGPLAISAIVDLGRQLFSGLTAIAEAGVLHRDVKPANVMLHRESDGQMLLKLVDFGIARSRQDVRRLTNTGAIVGTPHYMSPEQLRGEPLDARADMYAACAVLYEATTGRPPFDAPVTALVIGQILSSALPPVRTLRPECPEGLAALIERGLSRKRADRASHPMELVMALDALAQSENLPTGALAWAADAGRSHTAPIHFSRRRHATPPNGNEPAEGPVLPIEDPEPARTPEPPDHVDDAPPELPPRRARGRVLAIGVLAACAGFAMMTLREPEPTAADARAPSMTNVSSAPAPSSTTNVDRLLDQGLEALARGEVDGALAFYRAAVLADPNRAEAHRGRGVAAVRAGLDDEAIAAYERYLSLAPDATDADRVRDRLAAVRARRTERLTGSTTRGTRRAHP